MVGRNMIEEQRRKKREKDRERQRERGRNRTEDRQNENGYGGVRRNSSKEQRYGGQVQLSSLFF